MQNKSIKKKKKKKTLSEIITKGGGGDSSTINKVKVHLAILFRKK